MEWFFTITSILVKCLRQVATGMKWVLGRDRDKSIHNMKQEDEFPYIKGHIYHKQFFLLQIVIKNRKSILFYSVEINRNAPKQ